MLKAKNSVVIILCLNGLLLYLYVRITSFQSGRRQTYKIFTSNKNIFFLETSSRRNLNSRQACSVESAARSNPDWAVHVLFFHGRPRPAPAPAPSPTPAPRPASRSSTLAALASLPNVFLKTEHLSNVIERTPLISFFINNTLKNSKYPVEHASDILRMLVLQKYGGVYLDLDMIVVKSFNRLPKNFVAKEIWYELANGVLAVSRNPVGHFFADTALREIVGMIHWPGVVGSSGSVSSPPGAVSPPPGSQWTSFGAEVVLKTMRVLCGTQHVNTMTPEKCKGFKIFEDKYFYPIPYERWRKYYDYVPEGEVKGMEDAYTHHTWGSLSVNASVHKDSLLARLARMHCPSVYALYGDKFGY